MTTVKVLRHSLWNERKTNLKSTCLEVTESGKIFLPRQSLLVMDRATITCENTSVKPPYGRWFKTLLGISFHILKPEFLYIRKKKDHRYCIFRDSLCVRAIHQQSSQLRLHYLKPAYAKVPCDAVRVIMYCAVLSCSAVSHPLHPHGL